MTQATIEATREITSIIEQQVTHAVSSRALKHSINILNASTHAGKRRTKKRCIFTEFWQTSSTQI
jgi:hypothetical protein